MLLVTKGITGVSTDKWVKRASYYWKQLDECFIDAKTLHEKGNIDSRVYKLDSQGSYSKCLGVYTDKDDSSLGINNSSSIQVLVQRFLSDIGCIPSGMYGGRMLSLKHVLVYDNNGNVGLNIIERLSSNTINIQDVRYVQYNELLSVSINMSPREFALLVQQFINNILDYTCRLDGISINIKPHDFPNIYYTFYKGELPILEVNLIESDLI